MSKISSGSTGRSQETRNHSQTRSEPTQRAEEKREHRQAAPADGVSLSRELAQEPAAGEAVSTLQSSFMDAYSPEPSPTSEPPRLERPDVRIGIPDTLSSEGELQRAGAPEIAISHPAGPAAAPLSAFPEGELDEDGNPLTGTLLNETVVGPGQTSHRYVTVNPLETDDPELAEEAFFGFNAPTFDALNGRPNPIEQEEGFVDPTGPFGGHGTDLDIVGLDINQLGGHVTTSRGFTPEGNPWAINSTTPGQHPLRGHITRSLIEHDGEFYIRTEGVGVGDTFASPGGTAELPAAVQSLPVRLANGILGFGNGAARDIGNGIVGPPTFHNLDAAAAEWVRANGG